MQISVACVCVGLKENRMSRKNGDRSRFDRQRKAKIHARTRIRELWKTNESSGKHFRAKR